MDYLEEEVSRLKVVLIWSLERGEGQVLSWPFETDRLSENESYLFFQVIEYFGVGIAYPHQLLHLDFLALL